MDLPRLMGNASALTTRRLDKLRFAHNSTAPAAMKNFVSDRNERKEPRGFQGQHDALAVMYTL